MSRCLIFNAAFPVLGGGERYTIALGTVIAESHTVTYAGPNQPLPERLEQLGFPPIELLLIAEVEFPRASSEYDLAVIITLDPPPPSFATKSLAMVQFPRAPLPGGNPARRWVIRSRLHRYHHIVNSEFTRDWLRRRWHVDADVLMPPVELGNPTGVPKENLILSVGRFVGRVGDEWNNKRQDALITAFSQLSSRHQDSWRLVLAGGCAPSPEMEAVLETLKQRIAGLNVSIETNVSPERLAALQDRARLFWHAAGFERPSTEPERAEHFGIATVEAMSWGVIPLVYADGGQVEIVTPQCGRLWRSIPELVEQSAALMDAPAEELDRIADAARAASVRFGSDRFERETREMLQRIRAPRPQRGQAGRVLRLFDRKRRAARWSWYQKLGRFRSFVP
jgi:glycosyltransferase involved in cell wall biosynthesis